jgi:hypothetical protein
MKSEERCALSDWPAKALIAPGVAFASMIDRAVSRSSVQRERRSRIRRFSLPYRCACCIGRGNPEPRRPNRILGPVIIPEQHCYGAVNAYRIRLSCMAYRRNGIRRSGRSRPTLFRFGLIIRGKQSYRVSWVNPSSLSGKWPAEPLRFRSVDQFQERLVTGREAANRVRYSFCQYDQSLSRAAIVITTKGGLARLGSRKRRLISHLPPKCPLEPMGRNGAVRHSPYRFRMLDRRSGSAGSRSQRLGSRGARAQRALAMELFQPVELLACCALAPRLPIALLWGRTSRGRRCLPRRARRHPVSPQQLASVPGPVPVAAR